MNQWNHPSQGMATALVYAEGFIGNGNPDRLPVYCPESSQRMEQETKVSSNARKVHKSGREKMRRDRLNECFLELGTAIDPDRPKNDKATILGDAIQMLKDLTAEVHKLKAEHTFLSQESSELTHEKTELKEEKSALKTEIDNLNAQCHQRLGCMYRWATDIDLPVIMGPPPAYPFPIPIPIPSLPFHMPIPLYPLFQNQSSSCSSSYHPFDSSSNVYAEQHPGNKNHHSMNRNESQSRWLRHDCGSENISDLNDVVTELELKMPGSASPHSKPSNSSTEEKKGWRLKQIPSENLDSSSSCRCSSIQELPESSSNSNGGCSVTDSH